VTWLERPVPKLWSHKCVLTPSREAKKSHATMGPMGPIGPTSLCALRNCRPCPSYRMPGITKWEGQQFLPTTIGTTGYVRDKKWTHLDKLGACLSNGVNRSMILSPVQPSNLLYLTPVWPWHHSQLLSHWYGQDHLFFSHEQKHTTQYNP